MATNGDSTTITLTTSAAVVKASTTNDLVVMSRVSAHNADTVARVVTWYAVPSGGSAGASNLIGTITVGASQTEQLPLPGAMFSGGDALYAKADAASVVNLFASWTTAPQ